MARKAVFMKPAIWALCFGAWILMGLLNSGSEVIDVVTGDQDSAYWEPITWEMTSTFMLALLIPFVVEFALRVRFATRSMGVVVGGHVAALVSFSLLHVFGMVGLRKLVYLLAGGEYEFGHLGWELLYEGFKDSMTYMMMIGLTYGFDYYRKYRRRELQSANLQASLALARLENLEHRLQPHFLFNTLNMISATMHEDVDRADRMLTRLSDLLRMSVQQAGRLEIRLSEELQMLSAYIDIMRARFERRLTVEVQADPGVEEAYVPPLLLQPLVENAVKHGIAALEEGGEIRIELRRNGTQLVVGVSDNGPGAGAPEDALLDKGLGLSMTAERLRRMYGDEQELRMADELRGGLRLSITIPFRTSPTLATEETGL